MRRLTTALLALFAVMTAIAGCSSGPAKLTTDESVRVTGAAGKAPTVYIPDKLASGDLVTKTLVDGHGPKLAAGDSYLANFAVYVWHGKTNEQLLSTYKSVPEVLPVRMGLSGLYKALAGQRIGSRVLAVVPPKYGYGSKGDPQLGIVSTDTMVWVVDLIKAFPASASATGKHITNGGGSLPLVSAAPGSAPQIQIPKSAPPAKLVVTTLIKGTGTPVRTGQPIVVRYVASNWQTSQEVGSNWPSTTEPTTPPDVVTLGKAIPAWNTGLVGIPVGSRVMLVVPPAEGYGSKGNSKLGIKGNETLVFVVDILAAA
jgi:FKBP-type peptidyl-prolyl cis-trans isomerase